MSPDGLISSVGTSFKTCKIYKDFLHFHVMSAYITWLSALTPILVRLVALSMKLLSFQKRAQINPQDS